MIVATTSGVDGARTQNKSKFLCNAECWYFMRKYANAMPFNSSNLVRFGYTTTTTFANHLTRNGGRIRETAHTKHTTIGECVHVSGCLRMRVSVLWHVRGSCATAMFSCSMKKGCCLSSNQQVLASARHNYFLSLCSQLSGHFGSCLVRVHNEW